MFAGREEGKGPQTVYIASNAYWEELDVELPVLPDGMEWELAADTWEDTPCPGPLGQTDQDSSQNRGGAGGKIGRFLKANSSSLQNHKN